MATVALSTTPTTLDPGTAYEINVVNSGATVAHVQIAGGTVFDQRVNPGQSIRVHTGSQAVTAFARSGSGQVTTTVYANPEVPEGSGAYVPFIGAASYTYNTDGTVATATEGGIVTTYTYNADGTVHTVARSGVTLTYGYNADGTLASVA